MIRKANRKADRKQLRAVGERAALKALYPVDFADGENCGRGLVPPGPRERGDYPKGFHDWPLNRRNAWFAGFNFTYRSRQVKNDHRQDR
jgi:hypothetical protein